MKQIFAVVLAAVISSAAFAPSAFASKGAPLCEKNPEAPQCKQSRPSIPKSLPERYSLNSLVAHAQAAVTAATGEAAGTASCSYVNSKTVAFSCPFVTSAGRACTISLLQIWSNADYQVNCQGGVAIRAMVNPGRVPDTMD